MKRQDKQMLDTYQVHLVDSEEIETFIKGLPKLRERPSTLDQMKLQFKYIPKYYLILLAILTLYTLYSLWHKAPQEYTILEVWDSIMLYGMAFMVLSIPQFLKSEAYQMEEMERSCRFSYLQILFLRLRMFAIFFLITISCYCGLALFHTSVYRTQLVLTLFIAILVLCDCNLVVLKWAGQRSSIGLMTSSMVVSVISLAVLKIFLFQLHITLLVACSVIGVLLLVGLLRGVRKELMKSEAGYRTCHEEI